MEENNKDLEPSKSHKEVQEVEIPSQVVEALGVIAKKVGGDFGMDVKLGAPGHGSVFDKERIEITLDPVEILMSPDHAILVAGHEGSHRAISRAPKQLGLTRDEAEQLYSQLGFGFLQNLMEDPAVNDWLAGRHPGIEPVITRVYDEDLAEGEGFIYTPEVERLARMLGYWPRFAVYGAEILRKWHWGGFLEGIDPDVRRALRRTVEHAEKSISTIPDPEKTEEGEIIETARSRFEINTELIWPEFKKLVELDINTEAIRQMVNDALKRLNELDKKRAELEDAKKKGDKERQEELEKEIEGLEKGLGVFEGLPLPVIQEIQEKATRSRDKLKSDGYKGTGGSPLSMDQLSKEARQAIQDAFDGLPANKKRGYRNSARRSLEGLEDKLNEELGGKLVKFRPQSQKERREQEEREQRALAEEERLRQLARELEQQRRARMTYYDRAYEEVADIIDSLYIRLKRFLMPQRHPRWKPGYPAGQRVDMDKAMQVEKEPRLLRKLWKVKTIPHKLDYRFLLLVDLSGSMLGGAIDETYKGVVVLVEVLEKLDIPYEVIGFNETSRVFKKWDGKLDREAREGLDDMREFAGGTTDTLGATRHGVSELEQRLGRNNYLVTLTDGMPNDSQGLSGYIDELTENGKIRLLGVGLGPETKYVEDFYGASLSVENVIPTEGDRRRGARGFSEVFADLLEDMIVNPESYQS